MTIKVYEDMIQTSPEWLEVRCGVLTASTMHLLLTPTLLVAKNDKVKAHAYEIAGQRISGYVEPHYQNQNMLRGVMDELRAKSIYNEKYGSIKDVGFIINDRLGFKLGFSPDGLVGKDKFIEVKSRYQRIHLKTMLSSSVPPEYIMQVQTGLFVSELNCCDFITYCGGLPMMCIETLPDQNIFDALEESSIKFEESVQSIVNKYNDVLSSNARLTDTERSVDQECDITV